MRLPLLLLAILACGYATSICTAAALNTPPSAPPQLAHDALLKKLQHAHALLLDDQLEAASREYQTLQHQGPARAAALLGLAHIAQRESRLTEAGELYRQVLRLQPQEATAQAALILLLANTALLPAISLSQTWSQHEPQQPLAHALHGQLLLRAKRPAEARLAYQKACQLAPANPGHAYNLAVSLDQLQRYQEARSWYAHSLQLAGKSTQRTDQPQMQFIQQRLQQLDHWLNATSASSHEEARP